MSCVVISGYCRLEGKGKGILQHHQLIAEFEALPEDNRKKLAEGAVFEILRSSQVRLTWIIT